MTTMKHHYYLMSGRVRYTVKELELTVELNSLVKNEYPFVNVKNIHETQMAMQGRFFTEVMPPSPDVIIKDVFIQAASYLGHMSFEEFNAGNEAMPSDTAPEDKPAQSAVESGSTPSAPTSLEEAPTASEDSPAPAEPSNEADKG